MPILTRKVLVNGRELSLRLEPNLSGWHIDTGQDIHHGSVLEVEPGVFSVILDGRSYEVRPSLEDVVIEDPRERRASAKSTGPEGRQSIHAPMPGKVVRLLVAEGDPVASGQGLIVIEAMKMQNEMKSPKMGKVVSLPAKEGMAVAAGQLLAVVE